LPDVASAPAHQQTIGDLFKQKPDLETQLSAELATDLPVGWRALAMNLTPRYPTIDGEVIRRFVAARDHYKAAEQLLDLCRRLNVTVDDFREALKKSSNISSLRLLS
jgi:hypothetical protein